MKRIVIVVRRLGSLCQKVCKMRLNPFAAWLDYKRDRDAALDRQREFERLDRAEERELFRQSISSMTLMVEKAFESSKSQNDAFKAWVDSFKTDSTPQIREWDEDADTERYLKKRGVTLKSDKKVQPDLPPELAGLSKLDQFEMLLDSMGK